MVKKYPKRIEKKIFGYHIRTAAFLGYGAKLILTGSSTLSIILWFAFSIVPELMCLRYKYKVEQRGFVTWRFKVLSGSYDVYKNKKYDCILAVPYDDSYTGKMIMIDLRKGDKLPENGSIIDVCTPGDIIFFECNNKYVLPCYYEINTVSQEEVDAA